MTFFSFKVIDRHTEGTTMTGNQIYNEIKIGGFGWKNKSSAEIIIDKDEVWRL